METSEPKWANPVLNNIWLNLLRLGGLQITYIFVKFMECLANDTLSFCVCKWMNNGIDFVIYMHANIKVYFQNLHMLNV